MGYVEDHERSFALEQVKKGEGEQAVVGKHYIAFDDPLVADYYKIPAGKNTVRFPIILKRDPSLKQQEVTLCVQIGHNENFIPGYEKYQKKIIRVADILMQPKYWDFYASYYFAGKYGKVKHQFMIDATADLGIKMNDDFFYSLVGNPNSVDMGMTDYWFYFFTRKLAAEKLFNRLSSTHLNAISAIDNPIKRAFYEMETIRGCWTVKELERQIDSLYYERSGLSKNKEALSALVQQQAVQLQPANVINTPLTLEFLGLNERALVTENDLKQAILDNLQKFLLEMGHGFCFEARQKRILIDEDYFFADLVFYHRILKCHVIVDLKIDKFHHEYASQLNMYLNYFKAEVMQPDDNPPIGILLCTEKGDTLVRYATAGLDPNIFVQKYKIQLPSEEEIKRFLSKEIG